MDSRTPAVSNSFCQQKTPHLNLVTVADSSDYAAFVAEVLREEESERERARASEEAFSDLDDRLLAAGFPVAFLVGGDLPDFESYATAADDDDERVTDIRIAKLHRFLRQLPPLQSKVIRLFWGIGCEPHTQPQIAGEVGLSQSTVSRTLALGMTALCQRFELPPDIAA